MVPNHPWWRNTVSNFVECPPFFLIFLWVLGVELRLYLASMANTFTW